MSQNRKISLKRQFLLTGAILSAIVFVVVYRANVAIQDSSSRNIETIEHLYQFGQLTRQIVTDVQAIEREVYQQAIIPTTESEGIINNTYSRLLENNNELASTAFLHEHSETDHVLQFRQLVMDLYASVVNIKPRIKEFLTYSIDAQKRYPGMSILTEHLLPLNNQFIEASDLAIAELEQTTITRRNKDSIRRIENLFTKARYTWAQQISWVRLFIANRSGVFGDAETSMQISLSNRELYTRQIKKILAELAELDSTGHLDLQQSLSLEEMNEIIKSYEIYFEEAKKIYTSDKWREDLRLLQNHLRPDFSRIWKNIHELETSLEKNTGSGIKLSQHTSSELSFYILLTGIAVLVLLGAGYFLFEYSLHKPITQIAEALNAEAKGIKSNVDTLKPVSETAILIDAFKNMQTQVHSRQTRLESVLESAAEGIISITKDGVIEVFNRAATELFGYQPVEIIGKNISILLPDGDAQQHQQMLDKFNEQPYAGILDTNREVQAQRKNGEIFPMSLKVSRMYLEGDHHYTAVVEDISDRKNMIHNLRQLAEHDSLTGLHNRHYFMDELDKTIHQHKRSSRSSIALLYVDLDNFKYINDTMGHLAGDQLIIEVASLFSQRARSTDILARLGGDEFAILLHRADQVELETVAKSYCELISNFSFKYEGKVIDVSASVGAAMMTPDIGTREDLLVRADIACHEAKRLGRNRCHLYSENDKAQMSSMSNDMGWTRRIKQALDKNQFKIACQPIINTVSSEVCYSEVLLRLPDENGNITMPGGFLPAAERFGLITQVDEWVLNHALEILSVIQKRDKNFRFSINLSAHTVEFPDFFETIKSAIATHNINPETLLFEVTESTAINNMNSAGELLQDLKAYGCKTALDDFGIGYSSFAYLKELPVDLVKIDGAFISDIDKNTLNRAMVRSINDIAHEMGKQTIAEYVESSAILEVITELGIDYAQGFYTGTPMILDKNDCEQFMDKIA